jgi:peptidyl-tRNA hydrolase, PTH1 family
VRFGGGSAPVDWLVIGLGNPGTKYDGTPHNVGFQVVGELMRRWGLGKPQKKWAGLYADGRIPAVVPAGPRVGVLLPQTYMNESGKAAGPARGALKVPLERVVAVHDEIDLRFGDIRSRLGGGLAGHNGLKSLKAGFASAEFQRVRIGVGRPDSTDPEIVAAYVLGAWRQPKGEVAELVDRACAAVERIIDPPPPSSADVL